MTFKRRIDHDLLNDYLAEGLNKAEIARRFRVHPSAITNILNRVKKHTHKIIAFEKSPEYVEQQMHWTRQILTTVDILTKREDAVNRYINGDHDAVQTLQNKTETKSIEGEADSKSDNEHSKGKGGKKSKIEQRVETFKFRGDPHIILTKIQDTKAKYLELWLKAGISLINVANYTEFQRTVMEALEKADPKLREQFYAILKQKQQLRMNVEFCFPEEDSHDQIVLNQEEENSEKKD